MPRLPDTDSGAIQAGNQPVPLRMQGSGQPFNLGALDVAERSVHYSSLGIQHAFNEIDHVGKQFQALGHQIDEASQYKKLIDYEKSFSSELETINDSYSKRTDWDKMSEDFKKDVETLSSKYGKDLKQKFSERFQSYVRSESTSSYGKVKALSRDGIIEGYKASLLDAEELFTRQSAKNGAQSNAGNAARANYLTQINSALGLGVIKETDAQKMVQKFDEKVAVMEAKQQILNNPIQAHALLSDNAYLPNIDPLKRINLKEEALADARQRDLQQERDENRAVRAQEKMEKQRGAEFVSQAVVGKVTLPQLREALVNRQISIADFNHGVSLLKQSQDPVEITNKNEYLRLYIGAQEGKITKDSIINSRHIAPDDKIKLLKEYDKAEAGEERAEKPVYKNDKDIIKSFLKPGGVMNISTPQQDQAYAYAVEQYDGLVKKGVDSTEAREKVLKTWEPRSKSYTQIRPLPTVGDINMDEQTFKSELDKLYESKSLTKEQYIDQYNRWNSFQKESEPSRGKR